MNLFNAAIIGGTRAAVRGAKTSFARGLFGAFLGGGGRRILTGATAGALYGGLASDANTPTARFGDVLGGALIGAGIGGLTTRMTGRGVWGLAKNLPYGLAAKTGLRVARTGLNLGVGMARFAYRHPRTALLLGGGVAGAYAAWPGGAGESGMGEAEMAAIAQRHGGPSTGFNIGRGAGRRQSDRQMFMESTFGLTQGLHQSRHRG